MLVWNSDLGKGGGWNAKNQNIKSFFRIIRTSKVKNISTSKDYNNERSECQKRPTYGVWPS